MEVLAIGPLPVASVLWQPSRGVFAFTAVCKATFTLVPGTSALAEVQEAPNEDDDYWDDDPARSVHAPNDLVPFKPRADVLLVGHAFPPRGESVRTLVARMIVGELNKAIELFGERFWTADGQLVEGRKFKRAPLRYERAGAGSDHSNPVGMGLDRADAKGRIPLPNLQRPGLSIGNQREVIEPVGFGPIAPSWPARMEKLGPHAGSWSHTKWRYKPLPADIDPAYFNAAPRDQQVAELRHEETIVLENLHPDHPRLVTRLPGLRPRAFLERPGKAPKPVALRCDTLWIDTDRSICTLTWRGRVMLEHANQEGCVWIALEQSGRTLSWADVAPLRPAVTVTPEEVDLVTVDTDRTGEIPVPQGLTTTLAPLPLVQRPVIPFGRSAPSPDSAPPIAPPPLVTAPVVSEAPPPAMGFGSGGIPLGPNAKPGSVADISDGAAGYRYEPARSAPPVEAAHHTVERAAPMAVAEPIELLWFDSSHVARMRKHPAWAVLLMERELRALDQKVDAATSGDSSDDEPETDEDADRRDVFEILARGTPITAARVKDALDASVGEHGKVEHPLVLVAGDLRVAFDEIESLRAAVVALMPLLPAADKSLKDAAEAGAELLRSPWLESGRSLAEGALTRIRKAFAGTTRQLPATYVDEIVERAVLQGRHYQRRTVLGQSWLRAFLTTGKGEEALLVYLPERLVKELPMFPEVRVRVVAEVRWRQDKFEAQTTALRGVAVARQPLSV